MREMWDSSYSGAEAVEEERKVGSYDVTYKGKTYEGTEYSRSGHTFYSLTVEGKEYFITDFSDASLEEALKKAKIYAAEKAAERAKFAQMKLDRVKEFTPTLSVDQVKASPITGEVFFAWSNKNPFPEELKEFFKAHNVVCLKGMESIVSSNGTPFQISMGQVSVPNINKYLGKAQVFEMEWYETTRITRMSLESWQYLVSVAERITITAEGDAVIES